MGTSISVASPRATNILAEDLGLVAWTCDPNIGTGGTTGAITTGTVYLNAVYVRSPRTITKAYHSVGTVGNTLTLNQCLVGLYNAAGTRLGVSGSMDVAWLSTGLSTATFTSAIDLTPGMYWIATLANGSTGPAFRMSGGGNLAAFIAAANAGLSASTLRMAVNGTSQTSMPSPITPASNSGTNSLAIWSALA